MVVLAKRRLDEAATAWAQGGIVGVLGDDDSVDSHVRDTQDAGAGLVDENTARFIAEHSAAAVEWLVAQGVPFSPDPEGPLGLHLTREGGHAVRRIAHAADATGRAIHEALLAQVKRHPSITLRERWMAVDLITSRHLRRDEPARCYGVYALDIDEPAGRDAARQRRGAGHRRRGQGLPLHEQPRDRHRRRHRDGLARRLPDREHGVHPVPPDLPLPPPGAHLPHHRGAARGGRGC